LWNAWRLFALSRVTAIPGLVTKRKNGILEQAGRLIIVGIQVKTPLDLYSDEKRAPSLLLLLLSPFPHGTFRGTPRKTRFIEDQ
jgi:hypothetical protein